MLGSPVRFVPVQQAADLGGAFGQRAHEGRELLDLARLVEGVAVRGQRGPELRIAGDRGVPDAVERRDRVTDGHGVQPAPLPGREHPGVDLQMQVPVRVASAGGVVPHRHCLQRRDRHGDLGPAWPDPGGGVLAEPADDLPRGAVLRGLVSSREVRMQLCRERP
jgi:hypothetical protein